MAKKKAAKPNEKKLTEAQQDEAARSMLDAAFDALGDVWPDNEELPRVIAIRVLKALSAVESFRVSEDKRLGTDRSMWGIHTDPAHVVATAFWMRFTEIEKGAPDVAPESRAGLILLGFAQGLAVMRSMGETSSLLSEGDTSGGPFDIFGLSRLPNELSEFRAPPD